MVLFIRIFDLKAVSYTHLDVYKRQIFYYGFGKEKIFIKDVLKIEKSNNSIASSANSLDRIHLITTQKDFYISLKNNDNFIDKIKQRR